MLVLGAVVVSSVATALASALIRSPAEVAARTAPPEPSPILAPVERRVILTKVISRGTGNYGSPQELSVTASSLKSGPQVITTLPQPGAELLEGAVLLTVSGRPVFLLGGAQPSYRDLGPGVRGRDVEQLESALHRLGLDAGPIDGQYDETTGSAVAALYGRAGFPAMTATAAQLEGIRPVEANLIDGSAASAGVQLPSDEVIFVPTPDVRVSEVTATVGAEPAGGPLITVTNSQVTIDGALTLDEAGLVRAGMEVAIDEPTLGIVARGTVERVADRPGTDGVDGFHVFFRTVVEDPPPTLVGASVRLTVAVGSTGEAVLAVPVSAVSLAPDGSSRVERMVDGRREYIPVQSGVAADGYVAVTVLGGTLDKGDSVVIGIESAGPANGS